MNESHAESICLNGSPEGENVTKNKITGVILAAGKGTRMQPFSNRYPKPLLPICNKPLLHYQISIMKEMGINDIILVIGYLGYEIAQTLGDGQDLGVSIHYIEQQETLGIAHALGKLEPYISSPILLSLGDIFFVPGDLKKMEDMIEKNGASAVLAVKQEKDPEAIKRNFAIMLDGTDRVKRVMEKPRYVINSLKGCGLYLFDQHVFDAIRRTPRTAMRDEYEITDTIQILVDDGFPVYVSEVVKWDMNMTFPPDVLECNMFQLDRLGQRNLVGQGGSIHPDAKLDRAVLGNNVVISQPITITNSVIFPNTTVSSREDLDRFILTPDHQIDCRNYV